MKLKSLDKALRKGYRVHAFRSATSLRVVRVDKDWRKLKGYGEHPSVEGALARANSDLFWFRGHRPHRFVYVFLHGYYLTGSLSASSPLDAWLLRGNTVDAWQDREEVVFQLSGFSAEGMLTTVTKTGRGVNFLEAMESALEAEEVPVEKVEVFEDYDDDEPWEDSSHVDMSSHEE